jgi:c-di-GMP-binding flagellar brake protein YcgR
MVIKVDEKRKYNRVPFSYNDNIIGTFYRPNNKHKINAHILNLSAQGLYFTLEKTEISDIEEHEKLILIEINVPRNDDFILNIEIEIRRILDHPELEHIGFGCRFITFPESSRDQIRRFLEVWFLEGREG